jgi:hypothetical protein
VNRAVPVAPPTPSSARAPFPSGVADEVIIGNGPELRRRRCLAEFVPVLGTSSVL